MSGEAPRWAAPTVRVTGGRLRFGTWQGTFLLAHRTPPPRRGPILTPMGEEPTLWQMREHRPIHISGYERQRSDFYSTPSWVTACLLRHVELRGPIWEPCCGDGAIARVLSGQGHRVVATDLDDYGFGTAGVDFFACREMPEGCRSLVTNPPYGDGGPARRTTNVSLAMLRFIRHALDLSGTANGQLALLVRFQWIAGKRAAALMSSGPLDTVIALTRRIQWFDHGALTNSGQHHHAWIVFDYRRDLLSPPPRIVFAQ